MDEDNDDLTFIDPEILKKELVISLPILTESDVENILNGGESSNEGSSSSDESEKKPCLKRDQRRLNLLNNPDYGVILCFIEKFRSLISMKKYPLRIFEDNLISEREKLTGRFIDFHLGLLKKISSGKPIKREQFVTNLARFANRFCQEDGDHLDEHGYSKASIDIKLRVLKNLLETLFDRDQAAKNFVSNKAAVEIRSRPFGRDRLGASYWLFTDVECFVRVFRENVDPDRTWTNIAKNRSELESFIKLLITDNVVQKKFPEWKPSHETFSNLSPSNDFEERYASDLANIKKQTKSTDEQSYSSVLLHSESIKADDVDFEPVVSLDRDFASPPAIPCTTTENMEINDHESSDNESINSIEITAKCFRMSSSIDTRDDMYSLDLSYESSANLCNNDDEAENSMQDTPTPPTKPQIETHDVPAVVLKSTPIQRTKLKLVDYDDSESSTEENRNNDETSQDSHQIPVRSVQKPDVDLPIALRRGKRGCRSFFGDQSPTSSITSRSLSQISRNTRSDNKSRTGSYQSSRRNGRRQRKRHRGRTSMNGHSSSTTSDDALFGDDDDDDLDEEYLQEGAQFDLLINGNLMEEDETDDDDGYTSHNRARTVAQVQDNTDISYKSCSVCSQCSHPESLLLCEDCDDAYHLECLTPELLSIPFGHWYCPLCDHKRLCDDLIERLVMIIKDEEEFEMKRKLYVSKRRKRLTNVTVNVDRYVREPVNKPKRSRILSSDEEESEKKANSVNEEEEENEKKTNSTNDEDSVYGSKNDENRKPSDHEEEQQSGKRRVRSCRRKPQNYSYHDYDKKIKEAMIDAGVNKEIVENDTDDSDEIVFKRKPQKKRTRYLEDDDSDWSGSKTDRDFVPSRRRTINEDSRSETKENYNSHANYSNHENFNTRESYSNHDFNDNNGYNDNHEDYNDYEDFGMSDDDTAWRNRRQSSVSSISKKKTTAKSKRTNNRKSTVRSDEDSMFSETQLSNFPPEVTVKSEPTITGFDINTIDMNSLDNESTSSSNVYITKEIVRNEDVKVPVDNNRPMNNPPAKTPVMTNVLNNTPTTENGTNKKRTSKSKSAKEKPAKEKAATDKPDTDKPANEAKPQRQRRAPPSRYKKPMFQPEKYSDEEDGRPPPSKYRSGKKRRGSNESPLDEDDDYEILTHKRRLYTHGKYTARRSITDHIKKLVGDDDDDENNADENNADKNNADESKNDDTKKDDNNNNAKKPSKTSQYDEVRVSDDDDFPDDEEILRTTGLKQFNQPISALKPTPFQQPFSHQMPSFQYTMIDPTADFDLTCMPETPITEPSDPNQTNGNH